jgi:catechol 2,3-dioxygenase-like lactoylglutathione lyase family enzyme
MLVVQISRGLAPVASIVAAVQEAERSGWRYEAVCGLPLVAAKNAAAELALDRGEDLLLLEDDVQAPPEVWQAVAALEKTEVVAYARARVRGGGENVYTAPDGTFLYTGNIFCYIPIGILRRLPRPIFAARKWQPTEDYIDTSDRGAQSNGIGSDTGFWHAIRHLDPPPVIQELGKVGHLKHALNLQRNNLEPCVIEEW